MRKKDRNHIDSAIIGVICGLTTAKISADYFDGWATFGIYLLGMAISIGLIVAYLWAKERIQEPT